VTILGEMTELDFYITDLAFFDDIGLVFLLFSVPWVNDWV
jgi:hypothetical protein